MCIPYFRHFNNNKRAQKGPIPTTDEVWRDGPVLAAYKALQSLYATSPRIAVTGLATTNNKLSMTTMFPSSVLLF